MEKSYNNNAYVAVLDILFLSKIFKLRHDVFLQDLEKIRQMAEPFGFDCEEFIESSYILFKSENTRYSELVKILNFSLDIKKLSLEAKSFFDFNILVFKTDIYKESITRKVRKFSLRLPGDNDVWLLQESNHLIQYNFHLSTAKKDIQKILSVKEKYGQKNFLQSFQETLLFQTDLVDILNQNIENSEISTLGIVGKPNKGKTAFIRYLCEREPTKYIYLTAYNYYQEPFYPFIFLLYQIQKNFVFRLDEKSSIKLENLLNQVKLKNILKYKQIEIDICYLIEALAKEQLLIIVCDNFDSWPVEAAKLLKSIYQKLNVNHVPLKLICCMTGVYYPIRMDDIIHFSGTNLNIQEYEDFTPILNYSSFSSKEKVLATLPMQRVSINDYNDFITLLTKGLKIQELLIISIIQKFPYVLSRKTMVVIFQNPIIYHIVDYLLDYYFLIEIEDHIGKHLFCTLDKDIYPINLNIPEHIEDAILQILEDSMDYHTTSVYSLYVLSTNNIFLSELFEYYLYQVFYCGFLETVRSFIESGIFENYQTAIEIWCMIYKKNRSDMMRLQKKIENYLIDKDNIRFILPISVYYYRIHDYDTVLKLNKESIYLFNKNPNYRIYIEHAFLIRSKIFLAKCMFKEADEYINIGIEVSNNNKTSHLYYEFLYLRMLYLFFQKEFHSLVSIIEKYDFSKFLDLYGEIDGYLRVQMLIIRVYFELGEYMAVKNMLIQSGDIAQYYGFTDYVRSIICWKARTCFYIGDFREGFQLIDTIEDSEERLYFLSEGFHFYGKNDRALNSIMLALKLSLKQSAQRTNVGYQEFFNVYHLQEGLVVSLSAREDPLLVCIQGMVAYLHTFYGSPEIAQKILVKIAHRPSAEFVPFQHIFHYFYYLYLYKHNSQNNREALLYLSYAISILQNGASKILDTNIRQKYIYRNYWNQLLSIEGKRHNLFILGDTKHR